MPCTHYNKRVHDSNKANVSEKEFVVYKVMNMYIKMLFRYFVYFLFVTMTNAFCDISHDQVWSCMLGDACVNKYQLHSSIRSKTKSLRRQFLMAVEGSKYHRLFEDCDADKNGCLNMADILSAGTSCKRSCIWRQTMHDILC